MAHTPSQSLLTKIVSLATTIVGLVSTHESKTARKDQSGHVTAGSTTQPIGTSASGGTDNGYFSLADHVHTIDLTKITIGNTGGKILTTDANKKIKASDTISISQIENFPTSMTPTAHTHDQYFSNVEVTYDDTTGNLKIKLT